MSDITTGEMLAWITAIMQTRTPDSYSQKWSLGLLIVRLCITCRWRTGPPRKNVPQMRVRIAKAGSRNNETASGLIMGLTHQETLGLPSGGCLVHPQLLNCIPDAISPKQCSLGPQSFRWAKSFCKTHVCSGFNRTKTTFISPLGGPLAVS